MKFLTTFVATALAAVGAFAQSTITINSLSSVTVCRPSLITWSGGKAPYYLPPGQPSAPPLVEFPPQSGTSLTWNVNLAAGSTGFLNLRDSDGVIGQSANFIVGNSSDNSCVTRPLSVSGSTPTSTSGSSSVPRSTSTKTPSSNSTGDALAHSQFHLGAVAIAGAAVAFALAA